MNGLLFHRPVCAQLPRAGIVHRLDKDTSGLMVVAKSEMAMHSLVQQLGLREVDRRYLALVHAQLHKPVIIDAPIGRDPRDPLKMAVVAEGLGKVAATLVVPIAFANGVTLVQCKLATGRTHQIRVHMRSIGHPLVGDTTYGAVRSGAAPVSIQRQALHAWRLAFAHPRHKQIVSHQSMPEADFMVACQELGLERALLAYAKKFFVPNLSANLVTSKE
jgi:23S rRNA pseudouridine1911/1915/1917 synthase